MQDCDTQPDNFAIAGIISAGTAQLLTTHIDSDQVEYAARKNFKFFSQLNLPDSFANFIIFIDFILFNKAHYEKWRLLE